MSWSYPVLVVAVGIYVLLMGMLSVYVLNYLYLGLVGVKSRRGLEPRQPSRMVVLVELACAAFALWTAAFAWHTSHWLIMTYSAFFGFGLLFTSGFTRMQAISQRFASGPTPEVTGRRLSGVAVRGNTAAQRSRCPVALPTLAIRKSARSSKSPDWDHPPLTAPRGVVSA